MPFLWPVEIFLASLEESEAGIVEEKKLKEKVALLEDRIRRHQRQDLLPEKGYSALLVFLTALPCNIIGDAYCGFPNQGEQLTRSCVHGHICVQEHV